MVQTTPIIGNPTNPDLLLQVYTPGEQQYCFFRVSIFYDICKQICLELIYITSTSIMTGKLTAGFVMSIMPVTGSCLRISVGRVGKSLGAGSLKNSTSPDVLSLFQMAVLANTSSLRLNLGSLFSSLIQKAFKVIPDKEIINKIMKKNKGRKNNY